MRVIAKIIVNERCDFLKTCKENSEKVDHYIKKIKRLILSVIKDKETQKAPFVTLSC